MEASVHTMTNLFAQLGLAGEEDAIAIFVERHSPLPAGIDLAAAPFWTPSQAAFLREEILEDADWSGVIDQLNTLLRGRQ